MPHTPFMRVIIKCEDPDKDQSFHYHLQPSPQPESSLEPSYQSDLAILTQIDMAPSKEERQELAELEKEVQEYMGVLRMVEAMCTDGEKDSQQILGEISDFLSDYQL